MTRVEFRYKYWLLGIIPVAYLLIGFHFNLVIGMLSLRNLDPDYIYFMSGLSVAEGYLRIGHVDNPGSPLQYLAGLTFRLTYLIRSHDVPFLKDLLGNPDLYMNILNHVILILVSMVMLIGGRMTLRVTGSLVPALIVQTVPFYAEIMADIVGRVVPELLIPIPLILTTVILLKILQDQKVTRKDVLWLAACSAFGLSIKYNYFTLWLIPLLVIPRWKDKGLFLLFGAAFFMIFAIPAVIKLETTWEWIRGLATHSGQYGTGGGFINWLSFNASLSTIISKSRPFYYFIIILLLTILAVLAGKKARAGDPWTRMASAVILVVLLHTFLVSRHYAYRYLIPMLSLMPLIILLAAHGWSMIAGSLQAKKAVMILLLILFIPGTIRQVSALRQKSELISNDVAGRMVTWHYVQGLGMDNIRLIAAKSYGCPFRERALMFSDAYSGRLHKHVQPVLKELYPGSYFHFTWDNTLRTWGQAWDSLGIFDRGKPVYLFIENDSQASLDHSMKFFFGEAGINGSVTAERKFQNQHTKEAIYLLYRPDFSEITEK